MIDLSTSGIAHTMTTVDPRDERERTWVVRCGPGLPRTSVTLKLQVRQMAEEDEIREFNRSIRSRR
jgi:hypothetical protein